MSDPLAQLDEMQGCGCHACLAAIGETPHFYVLCPECGCKRCPKATNHLHSCSQSNDSGQFGSSYGEPCPDKCCIEYEALRAQERAEFEDLTRELEQIRADRLRGSEGQP
jgi:hypothetical protein